MSSSVYVLAIAAAAFAFYFIRSRVSNPRNLPLPPGPKGLPFLGAIYDVPQEIAWKTFQEWGKKYGYYAFYNSIMDTQPAQVVLFTQRCLGLPWSLSTLLKSLATSWRRGAKITLVDLGLR